MHEIEPYYRWLNFYNSAEDARSPYHGKEYNYDMYSDTIYGYYIDPAWDYLGSETLYNKLLFVDYEKGTAVIELMGEWNDAINNDIMHFKRNIIEHMMREGISKFILIGESVFNFHGSDDEYYSEWFEEVEDSDNFSEPGWIAGVNFPDFIKDELSNYNIDLYINLGGELDVVNWRTMAPKRFCEFVDGLIQRRLN
ncbi:hypothetical protein [Fulvivirga lutea]|uniref:Uncharacterized protein n=1 Tax=Fulvivirga lutea TaxID=2810512 RepID=A0A974WK13_9BACT|nr:hypothetical protein [Fulvivirga lutea]QSE98632.1 hypothetical protein JR347_06015 [Fulvivirga lutea]